MAKKDKEIDEAIAIVQSVNKEVNPKDAKDDVLQLGLTSYVDNQCPCISTRSISLDMALGIGGVPRGRVIEIYGPESSGKTTLAATIVAEAQAQGDLAAYIDIEHAIDPTYMKKIGCNLSRLMFSQPDSGEQALQTVEKLVKTGKLGVIVVDSVAALVTQAELDGEIGDQFMAPTARLMSQTLRKLVGMVGKTKTCLIFINQLREKMGQKGGYGGSNETQPGGKALKFYSSVRIDIRRIGSLETGGTEKSKVGNETKVKIVKNKVAPPFKEASMVIMFGEGISKGLDVIDTGIKYGIIKKKGSILNYSDVILGQGRLAASEFLDKNPIVMKEIIELAWSAYRDKNIEESNSPDTETVDIDVGDNIAEEDNGQSNDN